MVTSMYVLLKPGRQLPCGKIISEDSIWQFQGTVSGNLGGREFLGCSTAHLSSPRVNVNRQGEGLSCGGESIITEEGPDPTEFPEWGEEVGEPGDRGMMKSAAGGACESPCNSPTAGGGCEGSPS